MKKLEKRPFALIGVNVMGRGPKALKEVMDREKLSWRSFADRSAIDGKWHVSGTPSFYVIDPRGVIRYRWVGSPGAKSIDAAVEKLLREAEGNGPEKGPDHEGRSR